MLSHHIWYHTPPIRSAGWPQLRRSQKHITITEQKLSWHQSQYTHSKIRESQIRPLRMRRLASRRNCNSIARSATNLEGSRWQQIRMHSHDHDHDHNDKAESVCINWRNRDGSITATKARVGSNLLSVARKYEIELEGACEGVCACSTCHIILEDAVFDALPDASEDEEDMLGERWCEDSCLIQSNIRILFGMVGESIEAN